MDTTKNPTRKLFILFLLFITILCVLIYYSPGEPEKMDPQVLEEKIISLGELATLQYHYKDTFLYKNTKELKGIELPFTTKSFLISYEGYIKAGVDLESITIQAEDNESITLLLYESAFTDNVIQEEDILIYDERSDLFHSFKLENIFIILEQKKKETEGRLRENGFLQEADEKAQKLLTTLLEEMGFESIKIQFQKR